MRKDEKTPLSKLGYEETDIAAGPLFVGVIVLFIFLGSMAIIGLGFYNYFGIKEPSTESEKMVANEDRRVPPLDHRLQGYPVKDMESFRKAEDLQIENYHWKDKNAGVVAIPLEKAMELIAERGLPTHTKLAPTESVLKPKGNVGVQSYPENTNAVPRDTGSTFQAFPSQPSRLFARMAELSDRVFSAQPG